MQFESETMETVYDYYSCHNFEFDTCACKVVEPKKPLPGNLWVWKAEFFYAFPAFEIEMLRRGYYVAYMSVGNTFGCPDAMVHFDHFYDFMTCKNLFDKYPILLGLSRGGLYIYHWACSHPDCVGVVYGDNPVCDFKSWPGGKIGRGKGSPDDWKKLLEDYHFKNEEEALQYPNPVDCVKILVDSHIPVIHTAGVDDECVPIEENTDKLERNIISLGGNIRVFRHPGGHHPHGVWNPAETADWIEANRIKK